MSVASPGLWRQPDFLKLWIGESISLVGSQITVLALPLVAVLVLNAGPLQTGILGAAQYAPFLLFGLVAGVWVDRVRRRPILIWTNLGRAALLGSVPIVAAQRLGVGRTIILGAVVGGLGSFIIAFASRAPATVAPLLIGGWFIGGLGGTIYNVTTVSLRQAITPDRLQGRMNATMRFLIWGTIPIGSLLGGALGETIGLGSTLIVGALGVQLSFLWPLLSPLRQLREPPTVYDAGRC